MPVLGTDISHWQDNPNTTQPIDFIKMKAAGANFCIFKATQGIYFKDRVFLSMWDDASNLIRGAFHFLDWSADAAKQAAHFVNTIAGHKLDFPPIVDFEYMLNVPGSATTVAELRSFVNYVETNTGRIPMIYTSPSYWQEFGSTAIEWRRYPLWIANYQVEKPKIPAPWLTHTIWQYTSKGNGPTYGVEAQGIDLDYFNGTLEDLHTFIDHPSPPPPPPPNLTDQEKLARLWLAHPELH